MRYLGEKSLSSLVYKILQIFWYIGLAATIIMPFIVADILFFGPVEDPTASGIDKLRYYIFSGLKNDEEWQVIRNSPLVLKIFIMFYAGVFMTLLLLIIKKGQQIFSNFQNNIVFNEKNVLIISNISKLLIIYSIITFNLSSLLISIILLILSDIFKNGSALQEEHDLTV
jgi:hypothetical protein